MSDDLRKLAKAATPGPWGATADGTGVVLDNRDCDGVELPTNYHKNGRPKVIADVREEEWRDCFADAAFIAAASPDVVLGLLDRIAELEASNKTLFSRLGEVIREMEEDAEAWADDATEWGAKAGALQEEVDKYKGKWDAVSDRCNSALFDLKYARKTVEGQIRHVEQAEAERDEAREAVIRLAGALDDIGCGAATLPGYNMNDAIPTIVAALADPVVKRIVEGR